MSTKTLFIATYNVLYPSHNASIWTNISKLIEGGISIICLQEVTKQKEDFLKEHLRENFDNSWDMHVFIPADSFFGTAILWDKKAVTFSSLYDVPLPKADQFTLLESLVLRLAGGFTHIITRTMVTATGSYQGKDIRISSLHLDHIGGPKNRTRQLRAAVSYLEKDEKYDLDVICGDFNTYDPLKSGKEYRANKKTLHSYTEITQDTPWTHDLYDVSVYSATSIFHKLYLLTHIHWKRKLDFIWGRGMKKYSAQAVELPGSDHRPVIATISF